VQARAHRGLERRRERSGESHLQHLSSSRRILHRTARKINYLPGNADDAIEDLDDYFRCKIGAKSDIRDLFVRFWGEVNPDFFKGTVVEKQAAEVLAKPRAVAVR
jgi:hypothetical protein